jgi:hypothetical protein
LLQFYNSELITKHSECFSHNVLILILAKIFAGVQ